MTTNPSTDRPFQFGLRSLFVLMAVVAAILGLGMFVRHGLKQFQLYGDYFSGRPGPMAARDEWPQQLKLLLEFAERTGLDVEPTRAYCVEPSSNQIFYWQMRSSPELEARMTTEWNLTPADSSSISRFASRLPNDWNKSPGGEPRYLSNYPNRNENFIARFDDEAQVVTVFYLSKF